MVRVIHSSTHKARKEHNDDGWEIIHEWMLGGCYMLAYKKLTEDEYVTLQEHRSRKNPWKILKGDVYERQFNECDGDLYTFRMNKKLYDIACKYALFDDF